MIINTYNVSNNKHILRKYINIIVLMSVFNT